VNKFSHTRFEPMGHTTNPDIRFAKSVVDYIFRWLGITFLDGYREASNGLPLTQPSEAKKAGAAPKDAATEAPSAEGEGATSHRHVDTEMLERAGVAVKVDGNGAPVASRSDQFARFQSDAPACDNCGAITVRNGNCYLCYNCGNSMGCS